MSLFLYVRLVHYHIYENLWIIGGRIATEGYDVVFLVTSNLLGRSCFTRDFITLYLSGRNGTAIGVYRLIESFSYKKRCGLPNRLPAQQRIHLLHNRSLLV